MKKIDDKFIQNICEQVEEKKRVRTAFEGGGKLSMDKSLPYLLVYRFPSEGDMGTVRFVIAEAMYLVYIDDKVPIKKVRKLLSVIAGEITKLYGGFLLMEIWSAPPGEDENQFVLYCPKTKAQETLETFEEELRKFKNLYPLIEVRTKKQDERHPPGMKQLMKIDECVRTGTLLIGLQIPTIFRRSKKKIYPIFLRRMLNLFSGVIKEVLLKFIRVQTTCDIANVQRLGTSNPDKEVWEVDKKLSEISAQFRFLLMINPINNEEAWKEFQEHDYSKMPEFIYPLLSTDPEKLKQNLYDIPISKIHDPTLSFILREVRNDLDKKITMLIERNTPEFLYSSIRLYGAPKEDLISLAEGILTAIPQRENEERSETISAKQFKQRADEELKSYRDEFPAFRGKAELRSDTVSLMVSRGDLYIGKKYQVPVHRVEALIQHEIGTHMLTYYNGQAQPLHQLFSGMAGYDDLQEGLAVLSEYLVGGLTRARLRILAARVVAVQQMVGGHDFVHVWKILHEKHGYSERAAFDITTRVFRGGGFTKDIVYLRGLVKLLDYFREGGELEPLLIGKIAQEHIVYIQELRERKILQPPAVTPRYLNNEDAVKRLKKVREGILIFNLIEKYI